MEGKGHGDGVKEDPGERDKSGLFSSSSFVPALSHLDRTVLSPKLKIDLVAETITQMTFAFHSGTQLRDDTHHMIHYTRLLFNIIFINSYLRHCLKLLYKIAACLLI